MNKATLIPVLIEAVVFAIPLLTVFIKLGQYKANLEDVMKKTEGLSEYKAETKTRVDALEKNVSNQTELLQTINNSLIDIGVKVQLILDDKIKNGDK